MMMVPMMVPQDAVNSVSAGFPAAHLMPGGCFAHQWMPSQAMAMPMPSNTPFHQQFLQGNTPFAQLPGNQNALQTIQLNAQQGTDHSAGAASLPQNNMMQQAQAQAFSFQVPGMTQMPNTNTESNPPSTGHSTPQFAQVPAFTQVSVPSLNQGMIQPQPLFNIQNPTMGMMFGHTTAGVPASLPNLMQNQTDTLSTQQTNTLGAQQPSSDKPSPSAHQGGGGNLAHCA